MKIQQMAFMIIALFFFFTLVGLFFLNIAFKDIDKRLGSLQKEQAISSLRVIANMPEISCSSKESICLDEDKLRIMSGKFGRYYNSFWPVASVRVYKVHPSNGLIIKCPAVNCNYFEIFDNGQKSKTEYSTFVSICKQIKKNNYVSEKCEIAKLVLGVINADEE